MKQDRSIVIIGCGAGGGTAAQFAKKTNRKSSITIFEKGKYPQYSKCGLPYAISGIIQDFNNLIEFSEEWFKKAGIELFLETVVEKIDVDKKIVIIKKGNEETKKHYNKLIIATGAEPLIPPIKRIVENKTLIKGVFTVRTIEDAKNISSKIKDGSKAVIIGAGFIGLEMAENLIKRGLNIKVIEALSQILFNNLDADMSKIVFSELSKNMDILLNNIVIKIESKNGKINQVIIRNKQNGEERKVATDFLIISTGCMPEVSLAKNAGCVIGKTGGIVVNERCETNIKDIYAVGDCTEYFDYVSKKSIRMGLGSTAVRQGIAAGINAAGGIYQLLNGVLLSRTSKFFNMEIAAVGPTTNNLDEKNLVSGKFSGFSRPKYFPGGKSISLKVIADKKTGKILSAQAVGNNAAQRVNTFAAAIVCGMTINNFRKLETAYAPPVAPTLDAVTLVCDIVSKKLMRK